jgi:hypothetical protein
MRCLEVCSGVTLFACLVMTTACAPAVAPESKVRRMGERVTVGGLIYNVFDTQWKAQLGDGVEARIPKDRFFLVHISVVNGGSTDLVVPTMTLVDDSGQTYTELSAGDQVPNWIGFLRHTRPAETLQGNLIFDVPPKHYRLRVSDENSQKMEDVDIPLNFSTETPEIPPPPQQ